MDESQIILNALSRAQGDFSLLLLPFLETWKGGGAPDHYKNDKLEIPPPLLIFTFLNAGAAL